MPILIFLHGLLGTKSDWQKVIENLPQFECHALDLPLHGAQKSYEVADFVQSRAYLSEQILAIVGERPYVLIGYSLGGRLALDYAFSDVEKGNLQHLILEGANLGLSDEQEKQARWQNDQKWAQGFIHQAPETVLADWYQQPIFADLTSAQRLDLIAKRKENCGANIGKMLLATSLAKQENFADKVRLSQFPIDYIVGERDQKFRRMAEQHQLNFHLIENAGHNAHIAQPTRFANLVKSLVSTALKSDFGIKITK